MRIAVLLTSLVLALAQAGPRMSIQGVVTLSGTGEGIGKVEIRLLGESGASYNVHVETVTDARGRFALVDVPPGRYLLNAQKGGYAYPVDGGATQSITVPAQGGVMDVALRLSPGAVIAGRVLGPDGRPHGSGAAGGGGIVVFAGRVLPDGSVTARGMVDGHMGPATQVLFSDGSAATTIKVGTDDRGEYRFYGLTAGKYYVWAEYSSWNGDSWSKTYFPGVLDRTNAQVLDVGEGAVTSGTDFVLRSPPAFTISGEVEGSIPKSADGRELVPIVHLASRQPNPETGEVEYPGRTQWDSNEKRRKFRIVGVPPGNYELVLSLTDWNVTDTVGRTTLQVGQDIQGIRLTPQAGVEVRGQFVMSDGIAKPAGTIYLGSNPEGASSRGVAADPAGGFTIPSVIPGTWKPVVWELPDTLALVDVRQGEQSVLEGFSVLERPPDPLQVILSLTGTVEGVVFDASQKPVASARVVMVPTGDREGNLALVKETATDPGGHFKMPAATGAYRVFAVNPVEFSGQKISADAKELLEFLRPFGSQGVPVTITPSATGNLTITPVQR